MVDYQCLLENIDVLSLNQRLADIVKDASEKELLKEWLLQIDQSDYSSQSFLIVLFRTRILNEMFNDKELKVRLKSIFFMDLLSKLKNNNGPLGYFITEESLYNNIVQSIEDNNTEEMTTLLPFFKIYDNSLDFSIRLVQYLCRRHNTHILFEYESVREFISSIEMHLTLSLDLGSLSERALKSYFIFETSLKSLSDNKERSNESQLFNMNISSSLKKLKERIEEADLKLKNSEKPKNHGISSEPNRQTLPKSIYQKILSLLLSRKESSNKLQVEVYSYSLVSKEFRDCVKNLISKYRSLGSIFHSGLRPKFFPKIKEISLFSKGLYSLNSEGLKSFDLNDAFDLLHSCYDLTIDTSFMFQVTKPTNIVTIRLDLSHTVNLSNIIEYSPNLSNIKLSGSREQFAHPNWLKDFSSIHFNNQKQQVSLTVKLVNRFQPITIKPFYELLSALSMNNRWFTFKIKENSHDVGFVPIQGTEKGREELLYDLTHYHDQIHFISYMYRLDSYCDSILGPDSSIQHLSILAEYNQWSNLKCKIKVQTVEIKFQRKSLDLLKYMLSIISRFDVKHVILNFSVLSPFKVDTLLERLIYLGSTNKTIQTITLLMNHTCNIDKYNLSNYHFETYYSKFKLFRTKKSLLSKHLRNTDSL